MPKKEGRHYATLRSRNVPPPSRPGQSASARPAASGGRKNRGVGRTSAAGKRQATGARSVKVEEDFVEESKTAAIQKGVKIQPQEEQSGKQEENLLTGKVRTKERPKLSSVLQSSSLPRKPSSGDGAEWRSSLQRYVRLFNRTESEQNALDLSQYVADSLHGERLRQRTDRLRERDLLRGAIPAGSETKAELIRINESAGEVSVLVRLHVKRKMEQKGMYYMEERQETERLWLRRDGQDWGVLQVEPVVSERRPRYGITAQPQSQHDADSLLPEEGEDILSGSAPFLNYELMPGFKRWKGGIPYRRELAAAYADRWWNEGNPSFELFDVNCTNYVSQCIFAGNAPMNYTGRRETGWWYKGRAGSRENWSYSWAVANAMAAYLSAARKSGLRAVTVSSADELQLGDVIAYDWNGEGRFQHTTIVTAFDSAGQPLVNANTVPSRHRYWDYRDSYAWTSGTKYRFFHIPDLL
ncbi:amidase domain-containing protein [Paenibacillus sp. CAU 1782]